MMRLIDREEGKERGGISPHAMDRWVDAVASQRAYTIEGIQSQRHIASQSEASYMILDCWIFCSSSDHFPQ